MWNLEFQNTLLIDIQNFIILNFIRLRAKVATFPSQKDRD